MGTSTKAQSATTNGAVDVKKMSKIELVAYAQTSPAARKAAANELLRRAENRVEKQNS